MTAIVGATLHAVSLPYRRAVEWTVGGREEAAEYLVLTLTDADGRRGAAETVCKPAWNGVTPRVLATAFAELAWPALAVEGLPDAASGYRLGRRFRTAIALGALLDNACRDLWLGATGAGTRVPAAAVITRGPPEAMAEAARAEVARGTRALKVKLGQGAAQDAAALSAIRGAVGCAVALGGDANGAYAADALPEVRALAADHGLAFLEDPCLIHPHPRWAEAIGGGGPPLLLDRYCEGALAAETFTALGARHLAAKPSRLGGTEAEAVIEVLRKVDGRACIGTFGESAGGAVAQLRLAAAHGPWLHPSEPGFHEDLAESYLAAPLVFEDGHFVVPESRLAELIDAARLDRLATARTAFGIS